MSTRTGEQRFEGKTNNVSAVQIKTELLLGKLQIPAFQNEKKI